MRNCLYLRSHMVVAYIHTCKNTSVYTIDNANITSIKCFPLITLMKHLGLSTYYIFINPQVEMELCNNLCAFTLPYTLANIHTHAFSYTVRDKLRTVPEAIYPANSCRLQLNNYYKLLWKLVRLVRKLNS